MNHRHRIRARVTDTLKTQQLPPQIGTTKRAALIWPLTSLPNMHPALPAFLPLNSLPVLPRPLAITPGQMTGTATTPYLANLDIDPGRCHDQSAKSMRVCVCACVQA